MQDLMSPIDRLKGYTNQNKLLEKAGEIIEQKQ